MSEGVKPSSPTSLEVAQLAASLLPYTDEPSQSDIEEHNPYDPDDKHECAFDARAEQAATFAFRLLHFVEKARSDLRDEQERRRREGAKYDAEHKADFPISAKIEMRMLFDEHAKGKEELTAEEFKELVFRKQKNKPSVKKFMQCWMAFEETKGCELPFTRANAPAALEFRRWYQKNKGWVLKHHERCTPEEATAKIRATIARKGARAKHRNETKQYGGAILTGDTGKKIDEAAKGLPKKPKR